MTYNYHEAMTADIVEYIRDEFTAEEITEKLADRYTWAEELHDDLWICDSITGNVSGSYWFSAYKAEEAICHNWHLLADALREICFDAVNVISRGAEWCDVTIRCYLLGECIAAALDEIEG